MKVRMLKHRRKARPWCVQAKLRGRTNFCAKVNRAIARVDKNARFLRQSIHWPLYVDIKVHPIAAPPPGMFLYKVF